MDTEEKPVQETFRKRLTVPSGFRNLLEGLTVEILRSNPTDIYRFAAEYFDGKLKERQGSSMLFSLTYSVVYCRDSDQHEFSVTSTEYKCLVSVRK